MREIRIGSLVEQGDTRVGLTGEEVTALDALRRAAATFFAHPEEEKARHSADEGLYGYRPYGMQWSDDLASRDECESFAYWADMPELVPGREHLGPFMEALRGYWTVAESVADDVIGALARHYRYPYPIEFRKTSYIEINSYGCPPDRELLQTRHEDGHLFTEVIPNKPGLEVELDGTMAPWESPPGEMTIMAGSLLTSMTGGEVPPIYHQVRNHHHTGRLTALYFVNTPFSGSVRPYVENDSNRGVDLAELSIQKCTLFGKPRPRVLV
jgi:isopenicillin N synthase-like dioxygenase